MTLRIGSLCSGYGGLDQAVQMVLDAELAWVADPDPGAAAILAHHHPNVPNHGDITRIDWNAVEPVDILTAGFPCQDISNAGGRAGIEGARSGIWSNVADAIRLLRPRYVVLENVAAILVRGFDRVAADLAKIGYGFTWTCLRASDLGAPHRRERWFCLAWPAADSPRVGRHEGWPEPARQFGGLDVAERGCSPASHAAGIGHGNSWTSGQRGIPAAVVGGDSTAWGQYEPAIIRWEHVTGRSVPDPTEPSPRGGRRLATRFVEWHMGVDDGHVTAVPGLSRNQQLRALGNGVVPQQGAAAVRMLLERAA